MGQFVSTKTLIERFNESILPEPNSGCWLWTKGLSDKGYGIIWGAINGPARVWNSHRVSWILHCGPIPDGSFVLHKCDVRCCVNPDHLFLGDHKENMADMARKKRGRPPSGEAHVWAALTADAVREIRSRPGETKVFADAFGVSRTTICRARNASSWKHVGLRAQLREEHPTAKLTWNSVREIRASAAATSDLAERYGVSYKTIWSIRSRRTWKDASNG